MKNAAVCQLMLLTLFLISCGSRRNVELDSARSNAADCLVRETRAIAPKPIDLETATFAVLARCDFPGVIERPMVAEHPGYRDYIHELVQKKYLEMADAVRRGIACRERNSRSYRRSSKFVRFFEVQFGGPKSSTGPPYPP
jgi:hypothetical protein